MALLQASRSHRAQRKHIKFKSTSGATGRAAWACGTQWASVNRRHDAPLPWGLHCLVRWVGTAASYKENWPLPRPARLIDNEHRCCGGYPLQVILLSAIHHASPSVPLGTLRGHSTPMSQVEAEQGEVHSPSAQGQRAGRACA